MERLANLPHHHPREQTKKALRRSHFHVDSRQVICPSASVAEFVSSPPREKYFA
jgi:hypothetical protein